MAVWHASNFKKAHQTDINICSGLSHPTRSLSRIVCRGQEGLKAVKEELSDMISRQILDIGFFKANLTTRYRREVERKSRYTLVSLRQF